MIFREKLRSYLAPFKFFLKKKNCRVIFFRIPSKELYPYLKFDMIQTVSDRIEEVANLDLPKIDDTLSSIRDTDLYMSIKRILKLGWLITELKTNGMKNPIQLIKSGDKYFCHPGTDRIIVATYIQPIEYVNGFYLWYPCIDPHPFVLNYEHYEVKCPFNFIRKFTQSNSFKFKEIQMTSNLDVSDKPNSNAAFLTAKRCFEEVSDNFNFSFLSFFDKMQWEEIEDKVYFKDIITFHSDTSCTLGGIKFNKINNIWVTV